MDKNKSPIGYAHRTFGYYTIEYFRRMRAEFLAQFPDKVVNCLLQVSVDHIIWEETEVNDDIALVADPNVVEISRVNAAFPQ